MLNNMSELLHIEEAARLNIVFAVRNPEQGIMEYCLQIGNRAVLEPDFLQRYCRQSPWQRILSLMLRGANAICYLLKREPFGGSVLCRMTYSHTEQYLPEQPVQQHWATLRRSGFFLYSDGRHEWSPADIYAERLKQGRETEYIPLVRFFTGGSYCSLISPEEQRKRAASCEAAPEN